MKECNGHLIYEPFDPHPKLHREGHCLVCDKGLGIYSVCGAGEAELGDPCKIHTTAYHDDHRCSLCGELMNYDEVDIGVGIQKGNYRCDCCGWTPEEDNEQYYSYINGVEV